MHEDLKLAEIARDYTEPGVTTMRDVWNQGKLFMYSSDKIQLPQNVSSPFDSSEVQCIEMVRAYGELLKTAQ